MKKMPMIILYVADQLRSEAFYQIVLDRSPVLSVPGMTEFMITDSVKLGLMPESGISKIICPPATNPAAANGVPRCELYLIVADPGAALQKAIAAGAIWVSNTMPRNWGDTVAYCMDPDGHILAFAS